MIVAIIQARMNSIRLPRKVARPIAGKSMLAHVIERTQQIPEVSQVVVATGAHDADSWILYECHQLGIQAFRGDSLDVLARYEMVVRPLDLKASDLIVRITADCPVLDPVISGQVIRYHLDHRNDYTANLRDWPDGLDTEVFTRAALRDAYHLTNNFNVTPNEDQEHVTPWMRRNLFCLELPGPKLRHLKWSVDTETDLEYVRELYAVLGPTFGWEAILTADPGVICAGCRAKQPHRKRSHGRMVVEVTERDRAETVWDLHEVDDVGGVGIQPCEAWAICQHQKENTDARLRS